MTLDEFMDVLATALAHEGIELPPDILRRIAVDLATRLPVVEMPAA